MPYSETERKIQWYTHIHMIERKIQWANIGTEQMVQNWGRDAHALLAAPFFLLSKSVHSIICNITCLKAATTLSSCKTQGLLALSGCWDFVMAPTRAVSAWVTLGAWQPMSPWFHKTLFYDANTSWPPEHSIYQMCNVCRNNPNKEEGK